MSVIRTCVIAATTATVLLGTGAAVAAPAHGTAQSGRSSAPAPLLSHFDDGSFETPRVPANSFSTIAAGQSIGPWRVTTGSVDLIGAGYWQAAEGEQSVDLNGTTTGGVAQSFTTTVGTTYTVTYSLAGNPGGAPTVKTGRVLIDGQNFQDFSFDVTGKTFANMGYVRRQVTFVATRTSTTLTFASTTPTNSAWGPVVDDVTVQSCPPRCCDAASASRTPR